MKRKAEDAKTTKVVKQKVPSPNTTSSTSASVVVGSHINPNPTSHVAMNQMPSLVGNVSNQTTLGTFTTAALIGLRAMHVPTSQDRNRHSSNANMKQHDNV